MGFVFLGIICVGREWESGRRRNEKESRDSEFSDNNILVPFLVCNKKIICLNFSSYFKFEKDFTTYHWRPVVGLFFQF